MLGRSRIFFSKILIETVEKIEVYGNLIEKVETYKIFVEKVETNLCGDEIINFSRNSIETVEKT